MLPAVFDKITSVLVGRKPTAGAMQCLVPPVSAHQSLLSLFPNINIADREIGDQLCSEKQHAKAFSPKLLSSAEFFSRLDVQMGGEEGWELIQSAVEIGEEGRLRFVVGFRWDIGSVMNLSGLGGARCKLIFKLHQCLKVGNGHMEKLAVNWIFSQH